MLVKSINRPAVLSWSPKFEQNSIVACGSLKNSNSQVSSNSKLELFELSSDKPIELLSIDIPSSFNRMLWTSVEANCKDLIVGAFDNGKVEVYDSQMLLAAESDGIIKVPDLHSGSVKGLCLSNFQPNLIASGSINGEIALWDLDNLGKASIINIEKSSKFGSVSDMSWNPKVPHIISAASDSGIVSIIDLRAKKEITTLSLQDENCRSAVSCVEWHPEISTNILVSCDSNFQPFAYLFDLRSPGLASNVFKGHSDGVLSLSWCQKDPEMVLSSGRDGRTLCWNPATNEVLREYYHGEAFDVQWCPKDPNIFCVSTFDGGIIFQSINELENESSEPTVESKTVEINANCFSPQWLNCPIGASFGGNNSCAIFRPNSQKVHLIKPKVDAASKIYQDLIQFEYEMKQNNTKGIYENIIDCESDHDKKYVWKLVNLLGSGDIRLKLLDLIEESFGEPDKCNELITVPDLDSQSSNLDLPSTISSEIVDKIIRSDFEGAVMQCIDLERFSDALFISNYGGKELREKIEDHISQRNGRFYLNLAKSIGRNEFESFVSTSPISQWHNILKAVCLYATPENLPSLAEILFSRLIEQGMKRPALFVIILTHDFDKILELWLEIMFSNEVFSDIDSDACNSLVKTYKLLRILYFCCPNYIESLSSISRETFVFGIVIKIKSLLSSFGLDDTFIYDFQKNNFYHDQIKSKNMELDEFVENRLNNIVLQTHLGAAVPVIHSASNDNIQSFPSPTSLSKIIPSYNQLSPSWQSSNIMYNDAPIVNPKLSKLSPQVGTQEINPETVEKALKFLADAVDSKTVPDSTCRIIADCFRKLSKNLICSKEYSNLSKTYIIALFEELSSGNFETAASLTANIIASFFTETKDWILPLKRHCDKLWNQSEVWFSRQSVTTEWAEGRMIKKSFASSSTLDLPSNET